MAHPDSSHRQLSGRGAERIHLFETFVRRLPAEELVIAIHGGRPRVPIHDLSLADQVWLPFGNAAYADSQVTCTCSTSATPGGWFCGI
jgi:hypothetical protein